MDLVEGESGVGATGTRLWILESLPRVAFNVTKIVIDKSMHCHLSPPNVIESLAHQETVA